MADTDLTPSDTDSDLSVFESSVLPGPLLLGACYNHSDPEGGYDYEFVETPPDNLVCKICHHPSREPHLTKCCGHTFCNSCVTNVKRSTFLSDACPMCREEKFTTYLNKQNKRDILSLHVLCTNTQRGCEWIGEVKDINHHLRDSGAHGCKFEDVHCPNSCGEIFERQNLANHAEECPRRLTHCHYCCTEGEYQFIEGSHKEQCSKFPVPCPNKCDITNVPREDLEEHIKVCPLEVVQCQYQDIGCEAEITRKDLIKHNEESTNKHLLLFKSIFLGTQNKLCDTQSKLADTQTRLSDTQNKLADARQQLDNTQNKLGDTQERLFETQIKLTDTQNKLSDAQRRLDSTQGRLGNVKHKLDETADKLDNIEGRLETAEEDIQENSTSVLDEVEGAKAESYAEMITVKNRIDELEATLKQKAKLVDLLFGEHIVNIHTQAAKVSSCNQHLPVIVKVPDFTRNKNNEVDWYSNPFFTHHNGYKMQLNVVPAGWDESKGHYMSVYLYIMEGPFDHLLKWQLKGRFQVTLLNQICDSEHHSVAFWIHAGRNQSQPFWYCDKFIPYKKLHEIWATCQYVKDDCLFFEIRRL